MKFKGSKMAILECCDCPTASHSKSKPFRVTLTEDDEQNSIFLFPKDFIEEGDLLRWNGWLVEEECELNTYDAFGDSTELEKVKFAIIYATCPIHAKDRDERISGLAHLCHHKIHWEYCYDFEGRVAYIKANKPADEIPTRLKYLAIVPNELLPGRDSVEWATYDKRFSKELDVLHDKLFPDCPWNGKTMFPGKD